ncbi:hypothetical protein COCCADRAFT_88129 [Bipolaris zeicola 26-R-13]|uniref:Uncharacterized protein n=1 Tax=Cochliobolus carbonum (strain 26-R-13) TaxID=930089 RepID=W6YFH9_COCC2|nr:uncharacterized protein COCCADRAFT_88129 [Bipolaris zeicola 26-R-13]EUC36445.1 hypothetical protein COCCADRAFT_88129 [Bipolaris zeicola 26-R-13]
MQAPQPTTSTPEFSWPHSKPFWIILITASCILLLRILYKLYQTLKYRRRLRGLQNIGLEGRVQTEQGTDMQAGGEYSVQRPARAVTVMRRMSGGSEVSVLPLYERFEEGGICGGDVRVEKRGKYVYVVGEGGKGFDARGVEMR